MLQQCVVGMIYIGDDKNPPLRNDITPMTVVSLHRAAMCNTPFLEGFSPVGRTLRGVMRCRPTPAYMDRTAWRVQ